MAEGQLTHRYELLLIGGSAGSLEPVLDLLAALPHTQPLAVVLVLHRRSGESLLPNLLRHKTAWAAKEADEKESIRAGTVYVAPADYHLLIEKDKTFSLDYSEKINYSRPAIDATFETAADVFGAGVMALLLSGANQDGTAGLKKIKEAGGYVMVQDPQEAQVSYMPQHAVNQIGADAIVRLAAVPALIARLLKR